MKHLPRWIRFVNELAADEKIQAMHKDNRERRAALRDYRRMLVEMANKNGVLKPFRKVIHPVAMEAPKVANVPEVYKMDDRAAKKEAMREAINRKFNGSALMADLTYTMTTLCKAATGERVKINEEFNEILSELREEEAQQMREERERERKEFEEFIQEADELLRGCDTVKDIDKDLSPKAVNQRINSCKNKKDLDDLLDSLDALGCDYDFLDDKINKKYREFSGYRVNRI